MKLNVFIPAAGLGERLQPITGHLPKPLLPILGKPLLERVIERLVPLGVARIGINLHHLRKQVSSWICNSKYASLIEMFYEENLLGTGGAIRNASKLLSSGTFLVHNTDILSDIDLGMLIENHEASGNLVTLAVHNHPELSNLRLDASGFLKDVIRSSPPHANKSGFLKQAAYTGIAVYSPNFIDYLPQGNSDLVSCWLKAVASGAKIGSMDVTGAAWKDLGRPEFFAEAVWEKLRSQGERVFIHKKSSGCKYVTFQGMTAIETAADVTGPVTLENSILLPGASVNGTEKKKNRIIGPGYSIQIPEPNLCCKEGESLPEIEIPSKLIKEVFGVKKKPLSISTLSFGGSDRSYHRLLLLPDSKSAVLMTTDNTDPDYERQLKYTSFFDSLGLPVPRLLAADSIKRSAITERSAVGGRSAMVKHSAIFEDLGDFSLYSWMKCSRPAKDVTDMYSKVLEIIARMHTSFNNKAPEFRKFDYDHLRWESSYFTREFVTMYCQHEIRNYAGLNDEFHRLATEVEHYPKGIIHRDCQSQNIMISQDHKPYLIDFQGARMGPPAYDLASLLWDPYVKIEDNLREELIDAYVESRIRTKGKDFDRTGFRQSILPCRLQRHMQALGAYAFLSMTKGKRYFEKFIPSALDLLYSELEQMKNSFPVLHELVLKLQRERGKMST